MLTHAQLDPINDSNYFVSLKAMKGLIDSIPKKREKRFDGSKMKRGMSKMMADVCAICYKNENALIEKAEMSSSAENMQSIMEVVAEEMRLRPDEFKSALRKRNMADARHIIGFIARFVTTMGLKEIGKQISDGLAKDHATVIHGCQKVVDKLGTDEPFTNSFNAIRNKLRLRYGIEFNLEDRSRFPVWYMRMVDK